jgi:hypothetical protein
MQYSAGYGGNGGTFGIYYSNKPYWHVTSVFVRYWSVINGIRITTSHRDNPYVTEDSPYFGGFEGR